MYFKIFHRGYWSRKTPRPKGPWRRACEVPSLLPELRVFWRSRQDAAAAGSGGSPRSLTLGPACPRLSPSSNRNTFEPGSPGTAAPAAALEVYFRHAAAPSALGPQPRLHPASPAPVWSWAFPAQIHSRVRPRSGLPRSEIIQTFCERISPSRACGPEACSRGAPEA